MTPINRVEPIKIKDHKTGAVYTLDFTRETVKFAETHGFDWDDIGKLPATMVELIWYTAFRRYDKRISMEKTTAILESLGGLKPSWAVRLRELYEQAIASLISTDDEEQDEEQAKNAEMTVEL